MSQANARLAGAVRREVRRRGFSGTLTRPVTASVSDTGKPTMGTALTTTFRGMFMSLSSYTDNREERSSLAQRGVRYLVMDPSGMTLVPQPHDVAAVGAVSWRVESSTPLEPDASVSIMHGALVVKL